MLAPQPQQPPQQLSPLLGDMSTTDFVRRTCNRCVRLKRTCDGDVYKACSRCSRARSPCVFAACSRRQTKRKPRFLLIGAAAGSTSPPEDQETLPPVDNAMYWPPGEAMLVGVKKRYINAFLNAFGGTAHLCVPPAAVVNAVPALELSSHRAQRITEEQLLLEGYAAGVMAVGAVLSGDYSDSAEHVWYALLANLRLQKLMIAEEARPVGVSRPVDLDSVVASGIGRLQMLESLYYLFTGRLALFEECANHAQQAVSDAFKAGGGGLAADPAASLLFFLKWTQFTIRVNGFKLQEGSGDGSGGDRSTFLAADDAPLASPFTWLPVPEATLGSGSGSDFRPAQVVSWPCSTTAEASLRLWQTVLLVIERTMAAIHAPLHPTAASRDRDAKAAARRLAGGSSGSSCGSSSPGSDRSDGGSSSSGGSSGGGGDSSGGGGGGSRSACARGGEDGSAVGVAVGPGGDIEMCPESSYSVIEETAKLFEWCSARALQIEGAGGALSCYALIASVMLTANLPYTFDRAKRMATWLSRLMGIAEAFPGILCLFIMTGAACSALRRGSKGALSESDYQACQSAWKAACKGSPLMPPVMTPHEMAAVPALAQKAPLVIRRSIRVWVKWAEDSQLSEQQLGS